MLDEVRVSLGKGGFLEDVDFGKEEVWLPKHLQRAVAFEVELRS